MDNDYEIIIGHYQGKSIWSKFIKLLSWWSSPITHTAILTPDLEIVYEAWKQGCVKHNWKESHHVPGTLVVMMSIPCTKDQYYAAYDFLEKTKGAKYDFKGVVFGFLAQGERQSKDKFFCTEWVETALRAGGLRLLDRIQPYKMSPSLAYLSPIQKFKCTKNTP